MFRMKEVKKKPPISYPCMLLPWNLYKILNAFLRMILESYRDESMNSIVTASENWLKSSVMPKIYKWCCSSPSAPVLPSLSLVSAKNYNENYHYLKEKYGKKYVQIWPECSDPLKYVFEDVAIAAYLMTLWAKEREDLNLSSKQTFVDLGCGNGLLVDILTSEGHLGIGIDVRKRKIWDMYESHTNLVEHVVEPTDFHIFPNYDWIIGNHSDELTPWIPVIAARSSYKMRVFLLPCCPYTFNGKYDRSSPGKTQYQSYLLFVHDVCEQMGFNVQEDKLRIPSTKRICFICMSRSYKEEEERSIDAKRKNFIISHSRKFEKTPISSYISGCAKNQHADKNLHESIKNEILPNEKRWITDFKPRERTESVRNCSKLDREFLDATVCTVADILLGVENYISLQKGYETFQWNSGGKIVLGDLIKLIDSCILKKMKNQCGGFQTFLRNHGNVFEIKNGYVQLNVPSKDQNLKCKLSGRRKRQWKKVYSFREKPCYFFFHHPQGCPLEALECNFSHTIIKK